MSSNSIPWTSIRARYDALSSLLTEQQSLDRHKRHELQKEFSHLSTLVEKYHSLQNLEKQIVDLHQLAKSEKDEAMLHLLNEETQGLTDSLDIERAALDNFLAPPDALDERSVFLEIRAGTGGQEAALFAADLLKMYTNYALSKQWRTSIDSASFTDLGGYREVVLYIQGRGAFGYLKHESGVHRVQRVPATETSGRVHTSTATIAVLPEAEEVDISIDPADLRIDVYRSSGAGGQHVNTTDSAVRITHIPTGVVVTCQDERSQHKNKTKAMKMLKSRLLVAQVEKQQGELSKMRKEQIGSGLRSEKVRTYNFPQNRVTDHQVELTLSKLDMVMEGDLDDIVIALREKERADRKKLFLAPFLE